MEDLLIGGWVAIASPLLFRAGGDRGPFDPGQPLAGLLRLAAVAGVLFCLAARQKTDPAAPRQASMTSRGAVGPFVGGLLLVTISGFTALGASTPLVYAAILVAAIGAIAVRFAVPPLGVAIRRALVSPFVMVAGGLYWTFIEAVVGTPGAAAAVRHQAITDPRSAELVLFFLVAFSAVYYAMLVYAPRQVAEREGGVVEWLIRYLAFAVSIALGIGWLGILAT